MNSCKNLCLQWETSKRVRYGFEKAYCSTCSIMFVKIAESVRNCPCCHCRLARTPKNSKARIRSREIRLGKGEGKLVKI